MQETMAFPALLNMVDAARRVRSPMSDSALRHGGHCRLVPGSVVRNNDRDRRVSRRWPETAVATTHFTAQDLERQLLRVARAAAVRHVDPKDIVQEAITRALEHPLAGPALRHLMGEGLTLTTEIEDWARVPLICWMVRTTKNVAHEHNRAGWRERQSLDEAGVEPQSLEEALTAMMTAEDSARLREAIATFQPEVAHAVRLRLNGLKQREIAAAMGRPLGTVGAWLTRSLDHLRQLLREEPRRT